MSRSFAAGADWNASTTSLAALVSLLSVMPGCRKRIVMLTYGAIQKAKGREVMCVASRTRAEGKGYEVVTRNRLTSSAGLSYHLERYIDSSTLAQQHDSSPQLLAQLLVEVTPPG